MVVRLLDFQLVYVEECGNENLPKLSKVILKSYLFSHTGPSYNVPVTSEKENLSRIITLLLNSNYSM